MPTLKNTKNILRDQKLAPKKRFGQNFLVNENTIEAILHRANPAPEDTIIEFGIGLGALTIPLANRVKQVIGIEIDAGLVRWHEEQKILPDNVTIIHDDLLRTDFNKLCADGERLKIIANLPYSISNPLLFKLIEHKDIMQSAVLMLQKEVAQRLTAPPRTKAYGVLSVLLAPCATVNTLMQIGPGQFHPRPKVDSTVVKINFHPVPEAVQKLPKHNPKTLKAIVKGAFQQRRKTLLNALNATGINGLNKNEITSLLSKIDINPKIRPDQLTVTDYIHLALAYDKVG